MIAAANTPTSASRRGGGGDDENDDDNPALTNDDSGGADEEHAADAAFAANRGGGAAAAADEDGGDADDEKQDGDSEGGRGGDGSEEEDSSNNNNNAIHPHAPLQKTPPPSSRNSSRNSSSRFSTTSSINSDSFQSPPSSAVSGDRRLRKYNSGSSKKICRICFEEEDSTSIAKKLVAPCLCRGSHKYVHIGCARRWAMEAGHFRCSVCNAEQQSGSGGRGGGDNNGDDSAALFPETLRAYIAQVAQRRELAQRRPRHTTARFDDDGMDDVDADVLQHAALAFDIDDDILYRDWPNDDHHRHSPVGGGSQSSSRHHHHHHHVHGGGGRHPRRVRNWDRRHRSALLPMHHYLEGAAAMTATSSPQAAAEEPTTAATITTTRGRSARACLLWLCTGMSPGQPWTCRRIVQAVVSAFLIAMFFTLFAFLACSWIITIVRPWAPPSSSSPSSAIPNAVVINADDELSSLATFSSGYGANNKTNNNNEFDAFHMDAATGMFSSTAAAAGTAALASNSSCSSSTGWVCAISHMHFAGGIMFERGGCESGSYFNAPCGRWGRYSVERGCGDGIGSRCMLRLLPSRDRDDDNSNERGGGFCNRQQECQHGGLRSIIPLALGGAWHVEGICQCPASESDSD